MKEEDWLQGKIETRTKEISQLGLYRCEDKEANGEKHGLAPSEPFETAKHSTGRRAKNIPKRKCQKDKWPVIHGTINDEHQLQRGATPKAQTAQD